MYVLDVHQRRSAVAETTGRRRGGHRPPRQAARPPACGRARADRVRHTVRPLGQPVLPAGFTAGGADHWATTSPRSRRLGHGPRQRQLATPLRGHPGCPDSFQPIENIDPHPADRPGSASRPHWSSACTRRGRTSLNYEMLCHRACVTKGLYGRTASKVTWDDEREASPSSRSWTSPGTCISAGVDPVQPLRLGVLLVLGHTRDSAGGLGRHASSRASTRRASPTRTSPTRAVTAGRWHHRYRSVRPVAARQLDTPRPTCASRSATTGTADPARTPASSTASRSSSRRGTPSSSATSMVKNKMHREYRGKLPYVPLFNSYIPGLPNGKSNF